MVLVAAVVFLLASILFGRGEELPALPQGASPTRLYERLPLEAFQSGLSWITILRKREGFRQAFAGFDPPTVAAFGPDDVSRLMADPAIVRNRAKIDAAIRNARTIAELDTPLDKLL